MLLAGGEAAHVDDASCVDAHPLQRRPVRNRSHAVWLQSAQREQHGLDLSRNPITKFDPIDTLHLACARGILFAGTHLGSLAVWSVFRCFFPFSDTQSTECSKATISSKTSPVPLQGTATRSARKPGRIRPSTFPCRRAVAAFTVTICKISSGETVGNSL